MLLSQSAGLCLLILVIAFPTAAQPARPAIGECVAALTPGEKWSTDFVLLRAKGTREAEVDGGIDDGRTDDLPALRDLKQQFAKCLQRSLGVPMPGQAFLSFSSTIESRAPGLATSAAGPTASGPQRKAAVPPQAPKARPVIAECAGHLPVGRAWEVRTVLQLAAQVPGPVKTVGWSTEAQSGSSTSEREGFLLYVSCLNAAMAYPGKVGQLQLNGATMGVVGK